jgi:hypothetical protein
VQFDEIACSATVGGTNVDILGNAQMVTLSDCVVYVPTGVAGSIRYGVRIRAGSQRTVLRNVRVGPWIAGDATRCATNTILVEAGAIGTVLEDVTTDISGGGGDILDLRTNTKFRNVNGQSSVNTKITAPVSSDFDGMPTGTAAGPIIDLNDGLAYYRLPDGTLRSIALSAPAAPANTVAPAITGVASQGLTIACTHGHLDELPDQLRLSVEARGHEHRRCDQLHLRRAGR